MVTPGGLAAYRTWLQTTLSALPPPDNPAPPALTPPPALAEPPGWATLSDCQRAILHLTALGLTNAQIGDRLCKATQTIKNQKGLIIGKLVPDDTGKHSLGHYVAQHYGFLSQMPSSS